MPGSLTCGHRRKFSSCSPLQEAIVDTTGAGDAFIGTMLYAICNGMPPEESLRLAAVVAATKCTAVGARTGLPHRGALCAHIL